MHKNTDSFTPQAIELNLNQPGQLMNDLFISNDSLITRFKNPFTTFATL